MKEKLLLVLKGWRQLNHALFECTEEEVKEMLDFELANRRRIAVVERLHQRYSNLRLQRERIEVLKACQ